MDLTCTLELKRMFSCWDFVLRDVKPLICVHSLLYHHSTLSLHPQTTLGSLLNTDDEWVRMDGR